MNPWALFGPPGLQAGQQLSQPTPIAGGSQIPNFAQILQQMQQGTEVGVGQTTQAAANPVQVLASQSPANLNVDPAQMQQWWGNLLSAWWAAQVGTSANAIPNYPAQNSIISPTSDDDDTLARQFYLARKRGKTYQQVIEAFAISKKQPDIVWKNYFLSHVMRFEELILRIASQEKLLASGASANDSASISCEPGTRDPDETASPTPDRKFQITHETHDSASTPSRPTVNHMPMTTGSLKRKVSFQEETPARRQRGLEVSPKVITRSSVRSRRNSKSGAVDPDGLPGIPSRSPTPPTEVVAAMSRGNLFTQADKEYFAKKLLLEYHQNPGVATGKIYAELASKAPHHSSLSWADYTKRNSELVKRIRAKASAGRSASSTNHDEPAKDQMPDSSPSDPSSGRTDPNGPSGQLAAPLEEEDEGV